MTAALCHLDVTDDVLPHRDIYREALFGKQDWTVDDLARLPEDLNYELIDGRLILPSPTGIHQDIGVRILLALEAGCPPAYLVFTDLSLEIDARNEPRPDVVVVNRSCANKTPVPVTGVLLAVEVISPSNRIGDLHAKAESYAAAGIEHYWLVDPLFPEGITLTQHLRRPDGRYKDVGSTRGVFETEVPFPVRIDLPALTARRRAMLEGAGEIG
ncbi:Uma2 family endonuclease [Actinoplanes sp. N902-109]|uniref:Uma2 family endonuclease n=1 Tax=Actinoplanes sp. (strain N902-109) TaxID=649831 RepID=UPI0003296275|nr:Uma2 family endonuclease [Actinoplanes sp. N902-109]AGL20389.1 hypothetical protein L083_6879 [Actinoplanes sp. N902-109]